MLQLEGAKRWRLHRCPSGPLPRSYCWDYDEKELGAEVEKWQNNQMSMFLIVFNYIYNWFSTI